MTKRTNPKKLSLSTSTIRDLSRTDLASAAGGTSVGTCTGCQWTWNPTDVTCERHCTEPPRTVILV
jgi:hypothetical protein